MMWSRFGYDLYHERWGVCMITMYLCRTVVYALIVFFVR